VLPSHPSWLKGGREDKRGRGEKGRGRVERKERREE